MAAASWTAGNDRGVAGNLHGAPKDGAFPDEPPDVYALVLGAIARAQLRNSVLVEKTLMRGFIDSGSRGRDEPGRGDAVELAECKQDV